MKSNPAEAMVEQLSSDLLLADPRCQSGAYIRKGQTLYRVAQVKLEQKGSDAQVSQVQLEHAISEKTHWRNAQSIIEDQFILVLAAPSTEDAVREAESLLT